MAQSFDVTTERADRFRRFGRLWAEAIATGCAREQIRRGDRPYLDRYFLAGWNPITRRPGGAVFLHHFVASDPADAVHTHPWCAVSLILAGGYREYRCQAEGLDVQEYRPGDVNVLELETRHRIELLESDCWSLFCVGPYVQPWSFTSVCP